MIQAFMHNWSHMGLDCATSAKDIISRDICESITKQLRDKRATPTLCESLSYGFLLLRIPISGFTLSQRVGQACPQPMPRKGE
jgi:hypothetical protein